MSKTPSSSSSGDSLVYQFFSKTAQVIVQSRISSGSSGGRKPNKWFNLELEEIEVLKEELKFWKGQLVSSSSTSTPPPPLTIDILLDISGLKPSSYIILTNPRTGRSQKIAQDSLFVTVDAATSTSTTTTVLRKEKILLETWQLALSSSAPSFPALQNNTTELPTVYKKCIIFFRSLYSFVRLMPSFKLCRKMTSKANKSPCKIVYRLGSSRVNSPLDAGLDQLHIQSPSTSLGSGLEETDFPSIETPLGVFTLHAMYRIDCDFSVQEGEVGGELEGLGDLEPRFFSPPQQTTIPQQQRSSLDSRGSEGGSNNVSTSSFNTTAPPITASLFNYTQDPTTPPSAPFSSSIPRSVPKEGLSIPHSNWRDVNTYSQTKPSSYNSPSPDNFFKNAMAGGGTTTTLHTTTTTSSSHTSSSHFPTPFTPQDPSPLADGKFGERIHKEAPPFSTRSSAPVNIVGAAGVGGGGGGDRVGVGFGTVPLGLGSASPPFALAQRVEEHMTAAAAQSLMVQQRRPSYIFPSSPSSMNSNPPGATSVTGAGGPHAAGGSPLIFTPTSSFLSHHQLTGGKAHATSTSTSTPPPPPYTYGGVTGNTVYEVESFLSTIEQAQSLRITAGGEPVKTSLLKGTGTSPAHPMSNSVTTMNALDRFRAMQKDNAEFARQVDYQLMGTFEEDQHSESVQIGDQVDKSLHGTTSTEDQQQQQHVSPKIDVPSSSARRSFGSNQNTQRGRRRSISADIFPSANSSGRVGGGEGSSSLLVFESLKGHSQSEDDELLFNMSDIHHQ